MLNQIEANFKLTPFTLDLSQASKAKTGRFNRNLSIQMNNSDKEALSIGNQHDTPASAVDDEMDSGSFNSVLSTPFEEVKTNDEDEQDNDDLPLTSHQKSATESIPTPPRSPRR